VALLTLNPDAVSRWARQHGVVPDTNADVQHSPLFRAYLERKVAAVNAQLARYEQVKYFDVLDEDFTIENGLATPTLKIRRRQIVARYLDRFEALYRSTRSRWGAVEPTPLG
jgi:long-chain acyl-CoA synthetase